MISKILIGMVRWYQKYISPAIGPHCKYQPTCSQYMIDAVTKYGPIKGTAMGIWRILRCNPFSRGGDDPVPKNPIKRRITEFIRGGQNDSRTAAETTETERE